MWRGAQSALFFYASCAPCAEARYRKKRKQEVKRGRADQEALAAEIPNLYRQALPSSTNPHWQAEIAAGPTLVSRGKKKPNSSRKGQKSGLTQTTNDSGTAFSTEVNSRGASRNGIHDSSFDFRRQQRDDEEPWEFASADRLASGTTLGDSVHSSSITRPPQARTRGSDTRYTSYRSPAINELHPPVSTKIDSREEAKWLMQPPPTADFMSGKDRTSRSRSTSGGSSALSSRSSVPLSREVSQRIINRKLQNAAQSRVPSVYLENLTRDANDPAGQRHDRDTTEEFDLAKPATGIRPSPRHAQLQLIKDQLQEDATKSTASVERDHDPALEPMQRPEPRGVASRPQLSTIFSDSIVNTDIDKDKLVRSARARHENRSPTSYRSDTSMDDSERFDRRTDPPAKADDSLKVLQELAPSSALFKTRKVSCEDFTKAADPQSKSRQPSQDTSDEAAPELFDSWYTPDFALDDWVHEHTKREVTQRWSMDL